MEVKLIKTEVNYLLENEEGVIIASTSLKKEGLALSLKNCQSIELGYDLDELANERSRLMSLNSMFKAGFQKALSIIGDKKFSEEDMINCWETAHQAGRFEEKGIAETNWQTAINYTQSLQQTEWDIIVEMEKVKDETKIIGSVKGVKGSGDKITTYKSIPKLDEEGCLILKRL